MRKNKGFTLIELLVTLTILGIVTGMSIPVIRNLTVNNSNTKYSAYLDAVVNAAKLYVDVYSEDLFGRADEGCAYVNFEDLIDHKYIKDFNSDGITCNTTSTYVEVHKHSYKGYLGCANESNTEELIFSLPNNGTANMQDPIGCTVAIDDWF